MIFGVILVLTGVIWFLQTIGMVDSSIWNLYFPVVLVVFGLSILFTNEENACLMCKLTEKNIDKKPEIKKTVQAKEVVVEKKKRPYIKRRKPVAGKK